MFDSGITLQAGADGAKSDINVGARAAFDVVDWNDDGKLDLVVGGMDGMIRVYLNQTG